MLHGTGRGEIQPWTAPSGRIGAAHATGVEDVPFEVAGAEMAADYQRRDIGDARKKLPPRGAALAPGRVPRSTAVHIRHPAGVVGARSAGEQPLLAVRASPTPPRKDRKKGREA